MDTLTTDSRACDNPSRVMVVDDDAIVCRSISRMLRGSGFDPVECPDGATALQLLEAQRFDLLLVDVVMPNMDGLELCRKLRASAAWHSIPIVLLTARAQSADVAAGLEAGADCYLQKPIELLVLQTRLRSLLRFQQAQRGADPQGPPSLQDMINARVTELSAAAGLSPREQQVLHLLLLGRNVSDIGLVLGISSRTAKFHQANILNKLGAESRFDLMRLLR